MKELLAVLLVLIAGVVCEPPAPYPPSGWRPTGPTFDLPQGGQPGKIQPPRNQEYLPPLDPRNPANNPNVQYGTPDVDVSVQGLPVPEQQPIFQASPVNGQQYSGPNFNTDIRNLDQSYKQSQFQLQQERYREFERQRQLEAAQANANANRLPRPQVPRQFASRPTAAPTEATSTTLRPDERTTESTTEFSLNQGESLEDEANVQQKEKTSVEVSKQNLQEYPGELFLSSLAQLQLQPQFVPLQQYRAPLYYPAVQDASQKQVAGFDGPTHFAALPSVLAQQQAINQPQRVVQQQGFQNPALFAEQPANPNVFVQQPLAQYQPLNAYQPAQVVQPIQPQLQAEPLQPQFQPNQFVQANPEPVQQPFAQYQPVNSYQPPVQPAVTQLQATPVIYQPQAVNQLQPGQYPQSYQPGQFVQPNQEAIDNQEQEQQAEQLPQGYPPQLYQQPIVVPQSNQYPTQEQIYQAQLQQFYQNQVLQQQANQGQDSLQSGLDVNQQGNDIDQSDDQEDDTEQDNGTATAVATAFGTRTQPRVFSQYGAPFPVPRIQANPRLATTTESAVEDATEDGPAVAQAVAVASRGSRKSAKLRSRRVRPVFTVDRSGHLVLAQEQ